MVVSQRTLFQYLPSKSAFVCHGAKESRDALLTALKDATADLPDVASEPGWKTAGGDRAPSLRSDQQE